MVRLSPYEESMSMEVGYRWRKVAKLLAVCYQLDYTPENLLDFTEEQWALAAEVADIKPPSEKTVGLLRDVLVSHADYKQKAAENVARQAEARAAEEEYDATQDTLHGRPL